MDSSVRGRLLRLLERVRKFREKKVEVEAEAEEEKKPGEHRPPSLSVLVFFHGHIEFVHVRNRNSCCSIYSRSIVVKFIQMHIEVHCSMCKGDIDFPGDGHFFIHNKCN